MRKNTNIRIGHGAYTGTNAAKDHTSKISAVRDLMSRGIPRSVARDAIKIVLSRPHGYCTLRSESDLCVVEVNNINHYYNE